jgi:hypothetical protein
MKVAVFQVTNDFGTSIGAARLRRDLERELEQFES